MNRFRKNRKGKDIGDDLDSVPPALLASNPFKKTRKPEPEPKPQFDLSSALPSTDEFRTSLLMPKLSARFSMLREQDDPNTKIGKANDDSVLFPKRASKLNLFGHNPSTLADIAEVSSLHGRPSLALGRTHSHGSGEGDGTDDDISVNGGVMNRKRPGEGNVLFGGRQKVYKIPMSGPVVESQGLRGRAVYEDDVTLSAFQRLRLNEKEREKDEQLAYSLVTTFHDSTTTESEDTSPASRTDRTTTSSIASGASNRRSSTAATSIDEQPHAVSQPSSSLLGSSNTPAPPSKPSWGGTSLERNPTKTRRLYGQGLVQAVHEQQSSALSRLESLSRQRSIREFPPRLNRTFSKSATNLNERLPKLPGSPVRGGMGQRSDSPSLSAANSPELQSPDIENQDATPSDGVSTVPLGYNVASPSTSEAPDPSMLTMALQPEDIGKATAMGLFNKPNSSYDDQQFSRRQLQMYGGRNTPPSRRRSPPTSISQPETVGRPRGLSNTSYRSKAESTSSRHSGKTQNSGSNPTVLKEIDASPPRLAERSFLANLSASDSESDDHDFSAVKDSSAIPPALDGVHPALRSQSISTESSHATPARETQGISEARYPEFSDLNVIIEDHTAKPPPSPILEEAPDRAFDSPTLGPSGLGLSGLIRTHLRRDSDKSSIFPPPSPVVPPILSSQSYPQGLGRDAVRDSNPPASIHSNPWEYDDLVDRKNTPSEDNPSPIPQPDLSATTSSISIRARQILGQATALRELHHELRMEGRVRQPRQDDLVFTHKRDVSTETQKEREEFANELAERRRRVQEKLKSFAETESGSSSPGSDFSQVKPGNAFAILKTKPTRNLAAGGREVIPPKALKTLGFSNPALSSSSPALVSCDPPREEEGRIPNPLGKHANSSFPHVVTGRNVPARSPATHTGSNGSQDDLYEQSASREYSPTSVNNRQRDQSARSKSRPRHLEDSRATEEGIISQYEDPSFNDQRTQRLPPSLPSSARPSVEVNDVTGERSPSAASRKSRSNSRPAAPGYIDLRPIQPISPSNIGISPRPSPVTPYSANATPPLFEADMEHSSASASPNLPFGPHSLPQRAPGSTSLQKRVIDKSKISEPTFVSSTSDIPTVGLPAGARLTKVGETPPVPPMNPRRRRQTTTQTIIGALKGDKHNLIPVPPSDEGMNERSTFSDDDEKKTVVRQKLRKTSSEGGNLNSRIRQQTRMATSPAVPQLPTPTTVGGMI